MKKFLLLLLWFLLAVPTWATIAADGAAASHDNGATSATTVVVPLGHSISAGDLIVCGFSFAGPVQPTITIGDNINAGNYSIAVPSHRNTTISQTVGIQFFPGSASGTPTITLTSNLGSAFGAMTCRAYTVTGGVASLDCVPSPSFVDGTTSNPTTNACTTTVNGDLLFATVSMSAQTPTAGGSYTLIGSNTSTLQFTEDQIQGSAGSTTGVFTATTDNWCVEVATFKVVQGGNSLVLGPTKILGPSLIQ